MAALAHRLREAVENEDAEKVENFLKCGADPNLVLPSGIAAIHLASGKESESALRCLIMILQQGGDPNVRSIEALTPIHVAASWGCCKALTFLLRKGGDPTLQDQDGNTALDLALMENNRRCVVALQEYNERISDCPDQINGYCKKGTCLPDDITEMSSITILLESSYENYPFNSTKKCPFPSLPRNVTPGKGMDNAVISSQMELSGLDANDHSRKKHEISSAIRSSKLHLSVNGKVMNDNSESEESEVVSVTWMSNTDHCYEDFSSRWKSGIIDAYNPPIKTEIEQPTINTRTLVDPNSWEDDGPGNNVRKAINLITPSSSQADSAIKRNLKTNGELVFSHANNLLNSLILGRLQGLDVTSPDHAYTYNRGYSNDHKENTLVMSDNHDIDGGENIEEREVSSSSEYNSCQSECHTSLWENSHCSNKRRWVSDEINKPFQDSHSNQICNQNRVDALSCSQKRSYKPQNSQSSLLRAMETLPGRKEDMLAVDNKELTGTSTQLINGLKEGTDKEHFAVSIQSQTLTVGHESKTERTSGIISCTSQSPTLPIGGTTCHESGSQDLKIQLRRLLLLTKGSKLNLHQLERQTMHSCSVVGAESSCSDTVPVSVITETKPLVEHDLAINQNLKDTSLSFSNTSADTFIEESNVKEKADAELYEELKKMMLATKAFQSPSILNKEKSPCFVTPRTKSRLLSSKSRRNSSSLFDDSVEMPQRGRRVRSPDGMSGCSLPSVELGPKESFYPARVLFEQKHNSETGPRLNNVEEQNLSQLTPTKQTPETTEENSSEPETTVNISNFLTDDLSSSETEVQSILQFKQTTGADGGISESVWLTEDGESDSIGEVDHKNTIIGSAMEGKSLSVSLSNGSFLHSTLKEDIAVNSTKVPRYSFSRLSCVPKTDESAVKSCRLNTNPDSVRQEVPLSPGGRPVNVSQVEPVDYLYMDNERGHALIERHIPCTDQSTTNISENSDDTILYDWKNYKSSNQKINKVSTAHPPNRVAVELYRLSNDELARRLQDLGEDPRQVTSQNRKICILLLDKHLKEQAKSGPTDMYSDYSPELSLALRTFNIPDCNTDEATFSLEFDQPDKTRKWREGVLKSSFNYLLLDPRVTRNLPSRCRSISQPDCFRTFVSAVFYVGKGKRSRPYCHLYEALTHYNGNSKQPCSKIQHIMDIWRSGQGVLSLHCFQNTIPVEAYTREACMVDAIGLKMLTNKKKGVYYGQAQKWTPTRRRCLGVHMLHRAMQIFLAEGERQLRPPDIRTRQ